MARRKQEVYTEPLTEQDIQISIAEFLNTRYKEYALHTAFERAIPDVRDGFKPTARKIMYVALKRLKGGVKQTVGAFAGYVKAEGGYEHGQTSLEGNITIMSQDFKQNIPYFIGEGQFGTFYSPYAGAPRYIFVRLSDAFELLMKDNELLTNRWQEGIEVEPQFYLPIVPTILLNSIMGIAVGYSSTIINRNPIEVCNAVIDALDGEDISERKITPYVKGLQGEWRLVNGVYEHHGRMEVIDDTTVNVTAIPYNNTFDGYENHLNMLLECDIIEAWTNYSHKDKILYEIKFTKAKLTELLAKDSLYWTLAMFCRIERDNLTVIDFDDKIRRYKTVGSLIMRFVEWRLQFYEIRKQKRLEDIHTTIQWYEDIMKFIQLVLDEVIVLHKMTTKQVKAILDEYSINHKVLEIAVSRLTQDEQKKLKAKIVELKKEYKVVERSDNRDTYRADVEALIEKLREHGYEEAEVRHVTIERD